MFAEEVEWAKLSKEVANNSIIMQFPQPSEDLTWHLKPLYIKALINGKPINQVFVNGGAILNVMSVITLKKLGKNKSNLISTNIKMTNFIGDVTVAMEVLVTDIMVGSKTLSFAFFVVEPKPSYSVLLGKDWIQSN